MPSFPLLVHEVPQGLWPQDLLTPQPPAPRASLLQPTISFQQVLPVPSISRSRGFSWLPRPRPVAFLCSLLAGGPSAPSRRLELHTDLISCPLHVTSCARSWSSCFWETLCSVPLSVAAAPVLALAPLPRMSFPISVFISVLSPSGSSCKRLGEPPKASPDLSLCAFAAVGGSPLRLCVSVPRVARMAVRGLVWMALSPTCLTHRWFSLHRPLAPFAYAVALSRKHPHFHLTSLAPANLSLLVSQQERPSLSEFLLFA